MQHKKFIPIVVTVVAAIVVLGLLWVAGSGRMAMLQAHMGGG